MKRLIVGIGLCGALSCGGGNSPTNPSPTPTPTASTFSVSGSVAETAPTTFNKIPNALVEVTDGANQGKSTTTDGAGNFRLTGLQKGSFTLRASANGYTAATQSVNLTADMTVTLNLNPIGPRHAIGPGQFLVNVDIAAGRYFTDPPSSGCYWERESGLGGSLGEILANDFVGFNADQLIVDVLGSDKAFKSESDCGTWTNSPPRGSQGSSIPPGTWLVGAQVSPGTYHVTAGSGCYWERLRGFSGDVRDIIANDFESSGGSLLVSVSGVDTGFHSDGDCGTWTRASNLSDTAPSPEGESLAEIEANRDASRQRHGISW